MKILCPSVQCSLYNASTNRNGKRVFGTEQDANICATVTDCVAHCETA